MTIFDQLQQDHAAIDNMLRAHQSTAMDKLPIGVRLALKMYFMILEDAFSTLSSLIEFLTPRTDQQ